MATTLLTTQEAAERLHVEPRSLTVWRSTKRYPLPYIKVGGCVRYREQDLEEFIKLRMRQ